MGCTLTKVFTKENHVFFLVKVNREEENINDGIRGL